MSVFDNIRENVNAIFSDWIKIYDPKSNWTIEDFPYNTGVDENLTNPHCWKCVTVNQCWFKNEIGKKPDEFDYTKYTYGQLSLSKRGLYHPNCHDKKKGINVPKTNDIKISMPIGKINNFFNKKSKWWYSWGYKDEDKNSFITYIENLVKISYRYGNYEKEKHSFSGYQINIFIKVEGTRNHKNHFYNTWSSYIVYPNGRLRLITLIGGK